jgi:poly-beta-1,6-N-acetyl-D-glucosamine synthase
MSSGNVALVVLAFVGLYPVVTSGLWISGALIFRLFEEHAAAEPPATGWPGVTLLIPAYNEQQVIATCVRAALAVDYPVLEVLVLDDGSQDETAAAAAAAANGDGRLRVVRDAVNRGKSERLNRGFEVARHELVVVTDADTHVHPLALKLLVARMNRSPRLAAVAGAPHVTNRRNLLCAMQILEAASMIGLIRRTQAVAGRVGVVAGVLGLFRREAVIEVGGYRGEMATEDIDLTWRLLLAGWHTSYEPQALVGMEVPSSPSALWAQRRRWARGQGEVLHAHLGAVMRWHRRRLWPLALETTASLIWVVALVVSTLLTVIAVQSGGNIPAALLGLAWGIAVATVATLQLAFALQIDFPYDRRAALAFLLGPLYPVAFWTVSATAALWAELPALVRGSAESRVAWDIPRDRLHLGDADQPARNAPRKSTGVERQPYQ